MPLNNDDHIIGGPGNDFLNGGEGSDQLVGGTGDDVLWGDVCFPPAGTPGPLYDVLEGGAGNDVLWVRNPPFLPPRKDVASCGAGWDIASVDRADVVVGCEKVLFRQLTHEEHLRLLAQRGLGGRV